MRREFPEEYIGYSFKPEVKNVIRLTLAFAKAVGTRQDDKAENLVVSPYNAVSCLAMIAKGAAGETREELAKTLFDTDGANLDSEIGKLSDLNNEVLNANKDQVTLKTANAVWTNNDNVALDETYAAGLKSEFAAQVSGEDFADPATVKKINQWASDNTNGLISSIVEKLDPDAYAVLSSALYFKGKWTHPFDKELTDDRSYTPDNAETALTAMMRKEMQEEGAVSYQKGKDYEAIALTYGEESYEKGKYPSMRLVLVRPNDAKVSARDWLATQADGKIPLWLEPRAYQEAVGSIEVPRMDMKNKYDLVDPLSDMGIETAFSPAADLSPMTGGNGKFFVGSVTHDTVFKTDEEGSEAAAVTTGMVFATSVPEPPAVIDVNLDRSFVLALQDITTGAVLFVGAVNTPNNEMKEKPPIHARPTERQP